MAAWNQKHTVVTKERCHLEPYIRAYFMQGSFGVPEFNKTLIPVFIETLKET